MLGSRNVVLVPKVPHYRKATTYDLIHIEFNLTIFLIFFYGMDSQNWGVHN